MRNLLGRLNARSTPDLTQIADAWQTPLAGRDRLAQISQLYRTMTRLPIVRARWDSLDPDQQAVVSALIAAGEKGRTIEEIIPQLHAVPHTIRNMCVDLLEQGIVSYEGNASTLPIGEKPRLYVPIELASAIRTVIREVEAGDVSARPFPELIQTRDERDLFDAAGYWGIDVIPG